MKCFYHGVDNDGKCSGFWVRKLANHYDGYEQEFIPINYGDKFPFEIIQPNEQIYIVDYSISPEEMDRLLEITEDIVHIDHHISAIKKYENYQHEIKGVRYDGVAASMLTYCYLRHMDDGRIAFNETMTKDAPMFTKYIADYDVWKFEYGDDSKKFNLGSQLHDLSPDGEMLERVYNFGIDQSFCSEVIKQGETIMQYRDNWSKAYCESKGFETELEGHKCFALNLAMVSSDHFKSVNEDDYDIFVGFSYDGNEWSYSLRSSKVDCSEIAMKYGGGGHKEAAGFSTKELILKGVNNESIKK